MPLIDLSFLVNLVGIVLYSEGPYTRYRYMALIFRPAGERYQELSICGNLSPDRPGSRSHTLRVWPVRF